MGSLCSVEEEAAVETTTNLSAGICMSNCRSVYNEGGRSGTVAISSLIPVYVINDRGLNFIWLN
ncbi:MAG: hypothetical protein ACRD8W_19360 [Nitrososphaeraceae archaeon]